MGQLLKERNPRLSQSSSSLRLTGSRRVSILAVRNDNIIHSSLYKPIVHTFVYSFCCCQYQFLFLNYEQQSLISGGVSSIAIRSLQGPIVTMLNKHTSYIYEQRIYHIPSRRRSILEACSPAGTLAPGPREEVKAPVQYEGRGQATVLTPSKFRVTRKSSRRRILTASNVVRNRSRSTLCSNDSIAPSWLCRGEKVMDTTKSPFVFPEESGGKRCRDEIKAKASFAEDHFVNSLTRKKTERYFNESKWMLFEREIQYSLLEMIWGLHQYIMIIVNG